MRLILVLVLMLASWGAGAFGYSRGGYRSALGMGAAVLAVVVIAFLLFRQHHAASTGQRSEMVQPRVVGAILLARQLGWPAADDHEMVQIGGRC